MCAVRSTLGCVALACILSVGAAAARPTFAAGSAAGAPTLDSDMQPVSERRHSTLADPYDLQSEHFAMTYYTAGPDSIYSPALPQILLDALEHSYAVLSTDPCGMHVPYGTFDAGGGTYKIRVYVECIP